MILELLTVARTSKLNSNGCNGAPAVAAICCPAALAPLPGKIVKGIAGPCVINGRLAQYTKALAAAREAMIMPIINFLMNTIVQKPWVMWVV